MNKLLSGSFAAIVMVLSYTGAVSAQVSSVGLDFIDIATLCDMFKMNSPPHLAHGPERRKVRECWERISEEGRELLLDEDLALVVVDSTGTWFYRTSGIRKLRVLPTTNGNINENDLSNLKEIFKSDWFRNFYRTVKRDVFCGRVSASTYARHLAHIERATGITDAEKGWFRSIVGDELLRMDKNTRTTLLLDKKYGKEFVDAIALAKKMRDEQLKSVAKAFASGPQHTIAFKDVAYKLPKGDEVASIAGVVDICSVGGRNFEFVKLSSMGTDWWVAATKDDQKVPLEFNADKLHELLTKKEAKVLLNWHGTSRIWEVKVASPFKQ